MGALLAFTQEQAAQVAGVSAWRLRHWERSGVLRPSLAPGEAHGAYSRIYSFRDLVGLRTLAALRDHYGCSLQTLRDVGRWLTELPDDSWPSLSITADGGDVVLQDASDRTPAPTERREIVLDLAPIAAETEGLAARLTERQPDQIGTIWRNRHVLSNAPVIAGTRIPTAAIWDFHQAGYSTPAIIEECPRLTARDVERAIAFERERRSVRRRVG